MAVPVAHTASMSGEIIDLLDYQSAMVVIYNGAQADLDGGKYFTPSLQEGDNSALSDAATATDITDDFVVISGAAGAGAPSGVQSVGYEGDKRYIRIVLTETGVATGVIGAVAVLGGPLNAATAVNA